MIFLRLFVSSLAALTIAYAGLVWAINPRGEFAPAFLAPIVRDNRAVKVRLYRTFVEGGVGGLVLGSSRAVQMPPKTLDERSGLRFFNFAVERGRTEDYLAIYRWSRSQGPPPRVVLVGVDPEALQQDDGTNFLLERNPVLAEMLANETERRSPWRVTSASLKQYKQLFTTVYFHDAIVSLWSSAGSTAVRRAAYPEYVVQADGYLGYPRLERDRAEGAFDLTRELRSCLPRYLTLYSGIPKLSVERIHALRTLAREAVADGVRLILWISPNHPMTDEYLRPSTPYTTVLQSLRDEVRALGDALPIATFDFSDPTSFDSSAWWDCGHMDEKNLTTVARRLLGDVRLSASRVN